MFFFLTVLDAAHTLRLDLACNNLPLVPAAISSLINLEHLWLQGNPLASVHPDIQRCTRLKVKCFFSPGEELTQTAAVSR